MEIKGFILHYMFIYDNVFYSIILLKNRVFKSHLQTPPRLKKKNV